MTILIVDPLSFLCGHPTTPFVAFKDDERQVSYAGVTHWC